MQRSSRGLPYAPARLQPTHPHRLHDAIAQTAPPALCATHSTGTSIRLHVHVGQWQGMHRAADLDADGADRHDQSITITLAFTSTFNSTLPAPATINCAPTTATTAAYHSPARPVRLSEQCGGNSGAGVGAGWCQTPRQRHMEAVETITTGCVQWWLVEGGEGTVR